MEKKDLVKMTKDELLDIAKKLRIIGRHTYTKDELIGKVATRYNSLSRRKAKSSARKKKIPVVIEKVKEVFSRGKKIKISPEKSFEKKVIKERTPRPYWQPPIEPAQLKPQPQQDKTEVQVAGHEEGFSFPKGYGDNNIVLLVRDPWWIYSYWEIAKSRLDEAREKLGNEVYNRCKTILRVYDVTDIIFNGNNSNSSFDIEIRDGADNWYIDVGKPNRSWCVDIGLLTPDNKFVMLARSNVVRTPRFGMSEVTDEEWMSQEEDYWKLFGIAGGFGFGSSPLKIKKEFRRRFKEEISSGAPWSLFSFMEKRKERKFWMVVNTELIVYGATEKDAHVKVQGKPIKLRPDGTFTLRFALPDGTQHIPVEATSSDGIDKRKVTPIVGRRTE